ncbi:unnamed protein product, partial [marine sediment metagenome]
MTKKWIIGLMIFGLLFILFPINIISSGGSLIFEDDFTEGIKSEWETISG